LGGAEGGSICFRVFGSFLQAHNASNRAHPNVIMDFTQWMLRNR